MKKDTMRGTCPACFRAHDVDDSVLHKHGWSEVGRRTVGSHGNAWHVGACFGVGRKPFEVSPEGTWAFLTEVIFPAALAGGAIVNRLRARPTLTIKYEWDTGARDSRYRAVYEPRTIELTAGETRKVSTGVNTWNVRTFEYEYEWTLRLHNAEAEWESVKAEGARLYGAAAAWKAGTLAAKPVKTTTIHLLGRAGRAMCAGWRSSGYRATTEDPAAVTCSRCRKYAGG